MKNKYFFLLISSLCALTSCNQTKTYEVNDYRLTMKFHDNFKILQLTDLHLGIESDLALQLDFIKEAINETEPDLIILTGDNFMYSSKNTVIQLMNTLNTTCKKLNDGYTDDKLTKYAITFGNHDNQGDYYRYYINEIVSLFSTKDGEEKKEHKYAAFIDYEDDNLFGLTNYFIDLVDDRNKSTTEVDVKYRLHIIDSNTYRFNGIKYDYDVIHDDQLEHAKKIYQNSTTDKSYIGMAFFHIPFVEYKDAINHFNTYKEEVGQGLFNDKEHFPYCKNDSYKKLNDANINCFFAGHDHKNYGDIVYDNSIFSYGVKSTNQLYHDDNIIGYKLITLKDNVSKEDFININYVKENFKNVIDRNKDYE